MCIVFSFCVWYNKSIISPLYVALDVADDAEQNIEEFLSEYTESSTSGNRYDGKTTQSNAYL